MVSTGIAGYVLIEFLSSTCTCTSLDPILCYKQQRKQGTCETYSDLSKPILFTQSPECVDHHEKC